MCHRKIVTFYCHCPLRNMARCPHSAHVNWGEYSKFKTEQDKDKATPTTRVVLSSPAIPATPQKPQDYYCPKTGKRLFWHKRRPQDAQGTVHWDPLQSKTKWFPCAGYIATHTIEEWAIPLHECEDCPEYFGDSDIETKEVGLCEECKGGHGKGAQGSHTIKRRGHRVLKSIPRSSSAPDVERKQ